MIIKIHGNIYTNNIILLNISFIQYSYTLQLNATRYATASVRMVEATVIKILFHRKRVTPNSVSASLTKYREYVWGGTEGGSLVTV